MVCDATCKRSGSVYFILCNYPCIFFKETLPMQLENSRTKGFVSCQQIQNFIVDASLKYFVQGFLGASFLGEGETGYMIYNSFA